MIIIIVVDNTPPPRLPPWLTHIIIDKTDTNCIALPHPEHTVSSSTERSIMCDKILSPDTLNVDMGDFVWNNTASCKCRIWNEVQLISVCCPSLHFWLVINKIFWSWNWRAPIWWAVCIIIIHTYKQCCCVHIPATYQGLTIWQSYILNPIKPSHGCPHLVPPLHRMSSGAAAGDINPGRCWAGTLDIIWGRSRYNQGPVRSSMA